MRERQMGMYRGPGAAPHGEAAGLKGPGQASILPLQGVLCPQGEPVNTYVPVLTSTGPACATPDRWPLSVPPLPISLKETLNQLGVKSEEAGVGLWRLGKSYLQSLPQILAGHFYSAVRPKSCGESCGGCRACRPPEHRGVLGSQSLQE